MRVGIVFAFVTYVFAMAIPAGIFIAVMQATADLIGTALILWVALYYTNKLSRMQQAFGGLCGASAFINLASLPIMLSRQSAGEASLGGLGEFLLLVWGLSLLAYVIRHTFEIKMVVSIFIAYVYIVIWGSLISTLIPAPIAVAVPEISNLLLDSSSGELIIMSQLLLID